MSDAETEVLQEIEQAVTAFASRELGAGRARKVRDMPGGIDRNLWKQMAELGWVGVLVPDRYGGMGLGLTEMTLICRHLASGLLTEPMTGCGVLAVGALLLAETETLKTSFLSKLCTGDFLPTLAWQETVGEIEITGATVQAKSTPAGMVVSGTKCCVPYGDVADGFIVTATTSQGVGLFWVEGGARVTINAVRLADSSTQAFVIFDGAPAQQLCAPTQDLNALNAVLDSGRMVTAAELLGVSSACLDRTLAYLRTRVQFGKPIGSFQALQHRAVDLYIQKELSLSALTDTLSKWPLVASTTARGSLASRAKARCSQAALEIARESIQMHGAIAWTDECDIGLYVKRALLLSAWLGNATLNRRRYLQLAPNASRHSGTK